MKNPSTTNQKLIEKISALEQRIKELERSETRRLWSAGTPWESETLLRTYLENAPDGIYMSDMEGNFLYGNRKSEEIIGYSRDELIGRSFLELNLLSEKGLYKAVELLRDSVKGKSTGPDELELIHKDGHLVPVEINTAVVQYMDQNVVLGFVRDVTERKRAEDLARKNEEHYRRLFDLGLDACFLIDNETGRIVDANTAASSLYGYSKEELLEKRNFDLSAEPEETRKATRKELNAVPLRYHRKKDGTVFPVDITATHLFWNDRRSHLAAIRDITERKKVEDALCKSEEDYRSIYDNAMVGIFQSTPEGKYLRVNQALATIHGFSSPDEMIRVVTNIGEQLYVNPEDRRRYVKLLDGAHIVRAFEAQLYRKDKGTVWITMDVKAVRGPDGSVAYYEGIVEDITIRKRVEAEVRESEERYRSLFDNSIDAVLLATPDGKVLAANPGACRIFGSTEEEIRRIGKDGLIDPTDPRLAGAVQEWELTGQFRGELSFLHKNGTSFPGEISSVIFKDREGNSKTSMVIRDITERKLAEKKLQMLLTVLEEKNTQLHKAYEELKTSEALLIQSEKMVSLGQLSAGIAHELKNPLGIILQGIAYLQSSVEDSTLIDACNRIRKSANRADTIIQNLLSFSRQSPPFVHEADMNDLIEETLAMIEHQMNLQDIRFIRDYSHDIPGVKVDINQIKQVFLNIFINASDAMPEGGTITVTVASQLRQDGTPWLTVTIADTGTGIPEEVLPKVFDPFFTTKEPGKGTGLGLSVTKGIIEHHDGEITIDSETGEGTTVAVTMPCNPLDKEDAFNE